jgi:hypothetical protein
LGILGPRIVDGAVVKTGADWPNRLTTTR